ncbi:ARS binding protein 2-domain-containing protein [Biscogniauxia mediterranea]|nr:ARS binding protein 2-domain-containing protein [Biscogniauxia mediterranea]
MTLTPQASNGVHRLTPTSPSGSTTPRSGGARPPLPHRDVTSESIEDAYVSFILYCNPAVPLNVDTTLLREAFRTPPRSEGKSFSTFTLFELIRKLHLKEIKTWAELALKLGVEPPDQDKGQSSQKIQQYAVRLKRWMHSMHVNAFFDYLLDNPHPYWVHIPSDANPVVEELRDGVAAEDDMALRALLPHIRPRRGRKRPEEDGLSKSPSQRPRFESPVFNGEARSAARPPDAIDPWTAHPDGRNAFNFPPMDPRSSVISGTESAFPWQSEVPRDSLSAYPQSAITPSTRGGFWTDSNEPRSAISPKGKALNRRHGAKAVSSAWRSSGVHSNGKARGRPPINRVNETPLSAYPDERKEFQNVSREQTPQSTPIQAPVFPPAPMTTPAPAPAEPTSAQGPRPPRPGRLSLQVPERASGPVRLATPPPPVVMVNGKEETAHEASNGNSAEPGIQVPPGNGFSLFDRSSAMFTNPAAGNHPAPTKILDHKSNDRTNFDEIESLLVATIMETDWYDENGQVGPPASIDEILALVRSVIESVSDQALTKEAFLINLASLVGGITLIKGPRTVHRLEVGIDYTKYRCSWTLQYGTAAGQFTLTEVVPHSRWKKEFQKTDEPLSRADVPTDPVAAAEYWRKKYADLAALSKRRIENLTELKTDAIQVIKDIREGERRNQP